MADGPKWTDRFADWFVGLPYGRKFALSVILASLTILTPMFLAKPPWNASRDQVEVWCNADGSWAVTVDADDPRLKSIVPDPRFGGICDVAF